jgi:hypothetical protein
MGEGDRESIVEINRHQYRYEYEPDTKATRYLGPVGSAPPLSEGEFYQQMMGDIPKHTFIWGVDRDGKTRKWGIRTEPLKERIDTMGLGWNEGQPTEDRNRKALYEEHLGSRYPGNNWLTEYVFIDPGELMGGENFIDPAVLSGKLPGERVFDYCDVLYSTSVKKKADENYTGFFLPTFEQEEMKVRPLMVCFSRTKGGIPFFIIGEHVETKFQTPIQFSYKQTDSFRLWIVIERKWVDDFFEEVRNIYTRETPAIAHPVILELVKYRDDLDE